MRFLNLFFLFLIIFGVYSVNEVNGQEKILITFLPML